VHLVGSAREGRRRRPFDPGGEGETPAPDQSERAPVPADDGVGPHDLDRSAPVGPRVRAGPSAADQRDGAGGGAAPYSELVPEREHLRLEVEALPKGSAGRAQDGHQRGDPAAAGNFKKRKAIELQ